MTDILETNRCSLVSDAFWVGITPIEISPRDKTRTRTILEFSLVPSNRIFGDMQHVANIGIAIKDLENLIAYFKEHIQALKENNDHQSRIHVDSYGLHFQFQALSGYIDEEENVGRFGLMFMYNAGSPGKAVWVGFQSSIKIENVEGFISSLQNAIEGIQDKKED